MLEDDCEADGVFCPVALAKTLLADRFQYDVSTKVLSREEEAEGNEDKDA